MSAKLTKAQRRCLNDALSGHVFPPAQGPYRRRREVGLVVGCHARVVLNTLTAKGLLHPVDIETRAITSAGRAVLEGDLAVRKLHLLIADARRAPLASRGPNSEQAKLND